MPAPRRFSFMPPLPGRAKPRIPRPVRYVPPALLCAAGAALLAAGVPGLGWALLVCGAGWLAAT